MSTSAGAPEMPSLAPANERSPAFLAQFSVLWRQPDFGRLWCGQVVSHLGDAFTAIAMIWLVQELTGSRAMMGAINAVVSAMALSGLVTGALVDRWDRRRTMLFSDIGRGLVIISLPVLAFWGRLALWQIFVVAATMGLLSQFFYPAKQAFIPKLAPADDLAAANALSHMAYMLLMAAGFGLGGLLLGILTPSQMFLVDAVTFGVSALTIGLIRTSGRPLLTANDVRPRASLRQIRDDIREGLRFLGGDRLIATTVTVSIVANFVFAPISILLAAWARDVLHAGAQGFGLLEGSFMVGNLLGTLMSTGLNARFRRGRLVVWGVVLMGLPFTLFAVAPNLWLNIAALTFMGFCNGFVNILVITVIQQRVPDQMLGRLFGAFGALISMAMPLGMALGGWVADRVALSWMFAVIGIAMTLIGVSLFRKPEIYELT